MSHRRRPPAQRPDPGPPPLRERAAGAVGLFVRENVRAMLLVAGLVTLAQAVLPWTNSATDRIWFIVAGSVLLGAAVPSGLWR